METSSIFLKFLPELGSYPTYEEWKLEEEIKLFLAWVVLFLSYLWGMET